MLLIKFGKFLYFDNFPPNHCLMSDIVLGIFVADISFSGSKIPAVGETILGDKYNIGPGGKGKTKRSDCKARS